MSERSPQPSPRPLLVCEVTEATIEACRRGDRHALALLFRTHAPMLERDVAHLAGPNADLEDLLQTTWLRAIGAFPRFRGEASVRTWLTRIAVHVVCDWLRRPERRGRVPLAGLAPAAAEAADAGPPPDRLAEARRRLQRLYHHLEAVSPRNRVAFILHVLEGRSIEDVAALVGATRVATKSRVFLARRAILARAATDPVLAELLPERKGEA